MEEPKLSDEEKAFMREEFEAGLLEAGLQIERDKEVRFVLFCSFYSAFTRIIVSSGVTSDRHLCVGDVLK